MRAGDLLHVAIASDSGGKTHASQSSFHDLKSIDALWDTLAPKLPELRRRYAAAGGTLLVTTMVRSAEAHLRSYYRMWPPVMRNATREGRTDSRLMPLVQWIGSGAAAGLQVRSLLGGRSYSSSRMDPQSAFLFTSPNLQAAEARLAVFDLVGVTECLPDFLSTIRDRIGWNLSLTNVKGSEGPINPLFGWRGRGKMPGVGSFLKVVAASNAPLHLNAQKDALEQATRCDRALYEHVSSSCKP
jgi:hypothetical protein